MTIRTSSPTTADVLTDAPLDNIIERVVSSRAAASMLIVPPQSSFHCVDVASTGEIKDIVPISEFPVGVNGGYFVLQSGGHRPHPGERRPNRRRLPIAGRDGSAPRFPARRILEASRHLQGACRARRQLPQRNSAVGGLGIGRTREVAR